jgi:hypothetical protein
LRRMGLVGFPRDCGWLGQGDVRSKYCLRDGCIVYKHLNRVKGILVVFWRRPRLLVDLSQPKEFREITPRGLSPDGFTRNLEVSRCG